jgi:hypothetical protein
MVKGFEHRLYKAGGAALGSERKVRDLSSSVERRCEVARVNGSIPLGPIDIVSLRKRPIDLAEVVERQTRLTVNQVPRVRRFESCPQH